MKLKYYDIFAYLVPGYLIYQITSSFLISIPEIKILPSIAIAFILGYFINALGSWLEPVYRLIYGGRPSIKLLSGKDKKKIRFYRNTEVLELLSSNSKKTNPSYEELFNIALSYANISKNERITDFNAIYALSRSFLTCLLILFILLLPEYYCNSILYILLVPSIIITFIRLVESDYYYAREVLFNYLENKSIK